MILNNSDSVACQRASLTTDNSIISAYITSGYININRENEIKWYNLQYLNLVCNLYLMPQGEQSRTIHWTTFEEHTHLFAPVNPNDTALLKQTHSRNQQLWKTELEWACVGFAPSDAESTAQRHLFFYFLLSRFTPSFFWEAWGLGGPPEDMCWICTTLSLLWLSLLTCSE